MSSDFWLGLAAVFRAGRSAVPQADPLYAALKAMADKCNDLAEQAGREGDVQLDGVPGVHTA